MLFYTFLYLILYIFLVVKRIYLEVYLFAYLEIPKFKFQWAYKDGLQKSIKKLCEEFNDSWGLKQNKIVISGPPGSGKTYFA